MVFLDSVDKELGFEWFEFCAGEIVGCGRCVVWWGGEVRGWVGSSSSGGRRKVFANDWS